MKAEIKASGTLVIESETPLEAYALRMWCDENLTSEGEFKNSCNVMIKNDLGLGGIND